MKKVLAATAIAASLVAAGAAPASANVNTVNTGVLVGSVASSGGHIIGVCMTWSAVPVVTVTNPLTPSTNLVVVSVPVLTSIGIC